MFYVIQYVLFNKTSEQTSTIINDILDMCSNGTLDARLDEYYIHFYNHDKLYCSLYINGKYFFYATLTWPSPHVSIHKRNSPNVRTFLRILKFESELRNRYENH